MTISSPPQDTSDPASGTTRGGRRGLAVGVAVAALVVLGVAAAFVVPMLSGPDPPSSGAIAKAFGSGSTPAAAGPARPGPGGGPAGGGALLGRVTHGEFTLGADAGGRTVALQRGELVSVTPNAVTVRSIDGFTGTYRLEAGVQIAKDGQSATVGELAPGDPTVVVADRAGSALVAQDLTVG